MTLADDPREPTLAVLLDRAATRVSDTQAAVACGAGMAATAAVLLFAPGWWRAALATFTIAAFGTSVVAARSHLPPRIGRLVHVATLTLGVGATFVLGLSLLTRVLGTWIS
jgi:hypothetical protein